MRTHQLQDMIQFVQVLANTVNTNYFSLGVGNVQMSTEVYYPSYYKFISLDFEIDHNLYVVSR